MSKQPMILYFTSILLLFAGCRGDCTEGSGNVASQTRSVGEFTRLELNIPAIVSIHKGPSSITLSGDDNLMEQIETRLKGDKLSIGMEGCYSAHSDLRIEISTPDITDLEVNGSGSIEMKDTFQVKSFEARVHGSGKIAACIIAAKGSAEVDGSGTVVFSGSANEQKLRIAGSGIIRASDLPCNTADAEIRGSGQLFIYALEKINADIAGSGSVHYRGNAKVSSDISGSGTVISEN